MASLHLQGDPDVPDDDAFPIDRDPSAQPRWATGYDFGLDEPASDAFTYFGGQTFGPPGEYCSPEFCSPSSNTDTSQLSGSLFSQGFNFNTSFYTTPGSDAATYEPASTQTYTTSNQLSPGPPQPSLPILPTQPTQHPPKRRRTDVPAKQSKPVIIVTDDEDDVAIDGDNGSVDHGIELKSCRSDRLRKNRIAATKFRNRKRQSNADLESREQQLRKTNTSLNADVDTLRNEVLFLKNEILKHSRCDSKHISTYLNREAGKFA